MEYDVYPVDAIFPDGKIVTGEFLSWEENPDETEQIRLTLKLSNRDFTVNGDNLFAAMQAIRRELDQEKITLRCYGASRNVYPSPMILNMGPGTQAYKLTLGRPAVQSDLVSIFGTGPDITPVSVEEQDTFYREWVQSLGLS